MRHLDFGVVPLNLNPFFWEKNINLDLLNLIFFTDEWCPHYSLLHCLQIKVYHWEKQIQALVYFGVSNENI